MQSRIGENGMFFGAVNFIAAAGDYALRAEALGVDISEGNNYIAAIELERLFFKLDGGSFDINAGLLRMPFGYSQIWGPSDFINPKNPLKPDARPRAVLGSGVFYYPADEIKLLGFAATGRDPFAQNSGLAGAAAERHWKKASAQLLYSFERSEEFPGFASSPWTHRAGMSVKADLEVGVIVDMLYAYNREIENRIDGLAFSAGFDYSFFGANLVINVEYLYSGAASSTSAAGGGDFANENYLYSGATWRFSDFTNIGLALIAGIDDLSFTPLITFNHELFQGAALTLMAQVPIDRDLLFGDGNRGEFGPLPPGAGAGSRLFMESRLRLRF
jgi:hypothetical protein